MVMKKIKVSFIMIVTLFAIIITKFAFAAECDCTQSYPTGSQCWNDCLNPEDPPEPEGSNEGNSGNGGDLGDEGYESCDCSMGPLTERCTFVCNLGCAEDKVYEIPGGGIGCCPGVVENGNCDTSLDELGITMNTECLLNGQCKLNVYKVMGIRKSDDNPTVLGLFQDIVLAATTFVGTVIVIALVVSGLIFAFGSITGKDTKRAKTIIIDCFVGLLLVMGSYTIIRLIQFLAAAGS